MKRRFTEEQIIGFLREADAGLGYVPPAEFAARCRRLAGNTAQPDPSTTIQPPNPRAECY